MESVLESPDISEDESFLSPEDSIIIETSLTPNTSQDVSDTSSFSVEKNKHRKKKAFIIESSEEEDSDNEMEPLNESSLDERGSPENAQSNPEENVEHSLSDNQSNESDNEIEPLNESNLDERGSPENAQSNLEKNVEHFLLNDQSNRKISGISFLQGNFHNSTFAQQPTVDKSPKPSTSGNDSFRSARPLIPSRSPSPENLVPVYVSSDEETPPTIQNITTLTAESKIQDNLDDPITILDDETLRTTREVTNAEYQNQKAKIQTLEFNIHKTKNIQHTININNLPDKGRALIAKYEKMQQELKVEKDILKNMIISKETHVPLQPVAWENLEAGLGSVQPRTFGKQAIETLNVQKALTLDRLEQLHGSLKTCPDSSTYATDPEGLKIELMPHQKHAIAWLLWRENQKPSGGILADDMGLGKTLTMISLTLKSTQTTNKENEDTDRRSSKYPGGTLVICPASVVYQWEAEIKKRVKKGLITIGLYHGASRETRAKRLAQQSMVITTYALAMGDYNKAGPLYQIKWRRVILDEAHQIRNHKSQTSVAACNLSAKSRWALTGTPIHNKELDLYALLKFLRCSPFDDLAVWKRWVANKGTGGQDRLNTVMSSLILRRTKQQLAEKKMLTCMPERTWELVEIDLEKEEMDIYQKILIFSRTLFAQFLHQRAEKNNDAREDLPYNPNGEYYKMHQQLVKLTRVKKIKQHEILVLLLRLRQICCHPSLITNMLQGEDRLEDSDAEGQEELNLLDQLNKLNINGSDDPQPPMDAAAGLSAELETGVGLGEASRNLLNPSNPIFTQTRRSSKIKAIMNVVQNIPSEDKIIVVSQWTKLLHLVSLQFKQDGVQYYQLDGSIPVHKRMEIVENFNKQTHKVKILLLSLTAGGVGLNLVGANHLILSDLHWNPQLEIQAQDRIYRVGQTKPVKIYKLMAVDTIEQRIKQLQEKKLNIAEELLTGAKIQQHNKLSLDDLKMLFNM